MKEFEFKITDAVGIHARPAGVIVNKAKEFTSKITIVRNDGKTADAKRLFNIMSLQIKCNDVIKVVCEGEDEENAALQMQDVLAKNL